MFGEPQTGIQYVGVDSNWYKFRKPCTLAPITLHVLNVYIRALTCSAADSCG